ncbi:Mur ligase family protein [Enterococcus alishanensis]
MKSVREHNIKARPLKKIDFSCFTGRFLNEVLAEKIWITDFEYTAGGVKQTEDPNLAFISISADRLNKTLGGNRAPHDNNVVVRNQPNRFELLVTEKPIDELIDEVPQFIVPNTWEFMYEVGEYLRSSTNIPVIAITGSVGKSSTRMMIEHLLSENYSVLSNKGNHNTRFAMPLYMTRLVQSPDLLNLEVSLNALNYKDKGPQTTFIKPTISLVTSVGYAHMSGMKDLDVLAEFKANIFKGMEENGVAIINKDIPEAPLQILIKEAEKQTTNIRTYSMKKDSLADLYLVSVKEIKYVTEVTVSFENQLYTYYLKMPSLGMVENSLAALLSIASLGLDFEQFLPKFLNYQSLPKVLELKQGFIEGNKVDIYDDTHNAAIPSMINAITSFTNKVPYYSGTKILVLGQVADLGKHSEPLHKQLLPFINHSGADVLLGYGEHMEKVVNEVDIPSFWFNNLEEYLQAILSRVSENSLILLKGSISGSDYKDISPMLAKLLNRKN